MVSTSPLSMFYPARFLCCEHTENKREALKHQLKKKKKKKHHLRVPIFRSITSCCGARCTNPALLPSLSSQKPNISSTSMWAPSLSSSGSRRLLRSRLYLQSRRDNLFFQRYILDSFLRAHHACTFYGHLCRVALDW